jgi:hypothetical protein
MCVLKFLKYTLLHSILDDISWAIIGIANVTLISKTTVISRVIVATV